MPWFSQVIRRLQHKLIRKLVFRTVKATAKKQLLAFYAVQSKFPNMSNEELYSHAIRTRPGYTEETTNQILEIARQVNKPLRFRDVVHALVMEEVPIEFDSVMRSNIESRYNLADKSLANQMSFSTYYEIVCNIIPPDI